MNIHLTDQELVADINKSVLLSITVGSHLYQITNDSSDQDILNIYAPSSMDLNSFIWTHHQFQYKHNNTDFLYTSIQTFLRNIITGDSTINFEALFTDAFHNNKELSFLHHNKYDFVSYDLLKAYLGLIKRDLKFYSKNNDLKKLFHAYRGLLSFKAIQSQTYSNDWSNNSELSRIKQSQIDPNDAQDLASSIQKEIEDLRSDLNTLLDNKKINKTVTLDNLKKIDSWIMAYTKSNIYRSKQMKRSLFQNNDDIYLALNDNIIYK